MRKFLKKYHYQKDNGLYYLEKDNVLYSVGVIKLAKNATLIMNNDLWEVKNSHIFPSIVKYIYKSKYKFKPHIFNKLNDESIHLVKVLVIKGKNIDAFIDNNRTLEPVTSGEVVNGVYIVFSDNLDRFLNEYSLDHSYNEYELSY